MDLLAVDYVVLFVVLASAALSLMRGFTKEIYRLLAGLLPLMRPSILARF